jgi:pSer/pThr/pTyr-binding forkhead associated (FHA) protein
MSFFDTLARWLGLSEPAPAAAPGDAGVRPGVDAPMSVAPGSATPGANSPYAELWQSVDRHLAQFMVHSVLPHRQFEPDDVFKLVRIQVTGTTAAAQGVIDRFLAEFRPESRRKAVLAAVTRTCSQGVSTTDFIDFNRDFDRAELEESDPYDAQLADAHRGGYQLTLYGEWELQRAVPVSVAPVVGASVPGMPGTLAATSTAPLDIDIHDAAGRRQLQVAALPFALGRVAALAEQRIAGTFVSRRHGVLERDAQGRTWYRDTSVNGSVLDGCPIAPGERRQLRNGALLRLGGEAADVAECPVLTIRWPQGHDDDASTPIRAPLRVPGDGAATPIRAGLADATAAPPAATPLSVAPAGPLCVLAIKDAHGSRTVAVTRLPYEIGRSESADCRVPEANAGVSRDHLVIQALDAAGAHIDNNAVGKWGTEIGETEQPARFTLPWGRQVTLASRFAKAPAVTVLLLPATA